MSANRGRRAAAVAAVLCVVAGALAACEAVPAVGGQAPVVDPVTGSPAGADDVRVGPLASRDLRSGECGLFLWRRTEEAPLVFFFNSTTGRAAIMFDGRERALSRIEVTSASGSSEYGEQVFASNGGEISVRVAIRERQQLADGVQIPRAVMNVSDDRGWSAVLGVGGLAACQP